ncbi:MAG: hypothetical protein AAF577_11595 [Pseudomonadota bacterium]
MSSERLPNGAISVSMVGMATRARALGPSRRRGTTAVVLLCLLLKALLGPLVVASAAAGVSAKPGVILVPICAGGVITYVEMALDDDGGAPTPIDAPSGSAAVIGEACTVFGAFFAPPPGGMGLPTALHDTTAPAGLPALLAPLARAFRHPPSRGPPALF